MNPKYLEHIVVYLSVLVVCVLIGLLARMIVVGAGVDEFTATTVFWAVTALGMIVYAILTLLIEGLFSALKNQEPAGSSLTVSGESTTVWVMAVGE